MSGSWTFAKELLSSDFDRKNGDTLLTLVFRIFQMVDKHWNSEPCLVHSEVNRFLWPEGTSWPPHPLQLTQASNRSFNERTQHTHNGPANQIILPISTFLHPQSLYWGEFRTAWCLSMQLASYARQEGCLSLQEEKRNNLCIASCEMIFPFLFLFFHIRKSKRWEQLDQLSPYWQLFAAVCSLQRSQAEGQGFSSCPTAM